MENEAVNVKKCIQRFRKDSKPTDSNASFDYCYNYFYSYKDNPEELANEKNIHMSCLQLGFFLASWGMFRGRAPLREKSVKFYEPLLKEISGMNKKLWTIDVDSYNDENIGLLVQCGDEIWEVLKKEGVKNRSNILITKIMLGVFANVPAYDAYFVKFLRLNGYVQTFGPKSLRSIKEFYEDQNHKEKIDRYNKEIHTCSFQDSKNTGIRYTKAKIIDMCGFVAGGGSGEKNYEELYWL